MSATRRVNYLIGGMPIRIAKFGATDGSKTVGADACPAIPTSEAPGPWLYLGKIKSGQVEQVKKNVQIEGVNDATGMYEMEDVTMNNCSCNDNINKQALLHEIMALNFAVNDLVLYLDTHPEDSKAICMHNEYVKKVIALTEKYQSLFGPLTVNFTSDTWDWINEPWPWERGAY